MQYQDLTNEQKSRIEAAIKGKYPNTPISIEDILITRTSNGRIKMSYKEFAVEFSFEKPDKLTMNAIWHTLTGAAIAVIAMTAGIAVYAKTQGNK